jgi:hypothetical protein
MRQYRQLRGTFDADQIELVSDFVDVGDRVAVRMIWHGMGRGPESSLVRRSRPWGWWSKPSC